MTGALHLARSIHDEELLEDEEGAEGLTQAFSRKTLVVLLAVILVIAAIGVALLFFSVDEGSALSIDLTAPSRSDDTVTMAYTIHTERALASGTCTFTVLFDGNTVHTRTFKADGASIVLLGEGTAELGGSEYLKVMHDLVRGDCPSLDLARERALQGLLAEAAAHGLLQSAHDCSDGGIAVALAECCFDTGGLGAVVDLAPELTASNEHLLQIATLFGESASRVVVSVQPADEAPLLGLARSAGVPARVIGRTGGVRLRIGVGGAVTIDCTVAEAEHIWAGALERYFVRTAA